MSLQDQYDDAMFRFSTGDYTGAIEILQTVLATDPQHFDAQLALGMAFYRLGDYRRAIEEGHKARRLRPGDQLVHTNLSLFYMKAGDKALAEHHGAQARMASWKAELGKPAPDPASSSDLKMAEPDPDPAKPAPPENFPDMPWKKKP